MTVVWLRLDLFQMEPKSPAAENGIEWVEFHPDAMWLVLSVWDFAAKMTRPIGDILVPGEKKVCLFLVPFNAER